jgi:hypothetical protein
MQIDRDWPFEQSDKAKLFERAERRAVAAILVMATLLLGGSIFVATHFIIKFW